MNLSVEKHEIQWCGTAIQKVAPCSGTSIWTTVICKVVMLCDGRFIEMIAQHIMAWCDSSESLNISQGIHHSIWNYNKAS